MFLTFLVALFLPRGLPYSSPHLESKCKRHHNPQNKCSDGGMFDFNNYQLILLVHILLTK